jgi:hypothetical protein
MGGTSSRYAPTTGRATRTTPSGPPSPNTARTAAPGRTRAAAPGTPGGSHGQHRPGPHRPRLAAHPVRDQHLHERLDPTQARGGRHPWTCRADDVVNPLSCQAAEHATSDQLGGLLSDAERGGLEAIRQHIRQRISWPSRGRQRCGGRPSSTSNGAPSGVAAVLSTGGGVAARCLMSRPRSPAPIMPTAQRSSAVDGQYALPADFHSRRRCAMSRARSSSLPLSSTLRSAGSARR